MPYKFSLFIASAPSTAFTPLENPEKSLSQAIQALETTDSEQWEVMTNGMLTIQKLASFHPSVLSTRFSQVIRALSKQVY